MPKWDTVFLGVKINLEPLDGKVGIVVGLLLPIDLK
jgi:hypothetical protein